MRFLDWFRKCRGSLWACVTVTFSGDLQGRVHRRKSNNLCLLFCSYTQGTSNVCQCGWKQRFPASQTDPDSDQSFQFAYKAKGRELISVVQTVILVYTDFITYSSNKKHSAPCSFTTLNHGLLGFLTMVSVEKTCMSKWNQTTTNWGMSKVCVCVYAFYSHHEMSIWTGWQNIKPKHVEAVWTWLLHEYELKCSVQKNREWLR